jgi:hypothetical protein
MKKAYLNIPMFLLLVLQACNTPLKEEVIPVKHYTKPATIGFHFANARLWLSQNNADTINKNIVFSVNRTDSENFAKMDTVIIPNDLSGDLEFYLPFPVSVPAIKQINKVIYFSYPSQVFAAYENGELVYTGAVNMGRKKDRTPTGLFYANWKAEKTISTFNDEWELRWNFNIQSKEGIGWHQYSLPGYPASHSCLRLQENDARNLYDWADQWKVDDKENLVLNGTAVIVFGTYNFDAPKPWLQLVDNPAALDISTAQIEQITNPYLLDIMKWQTKALESKTNERMRE